ncbi:MAG: tetratricopeptide repeat protein [Candidatus Helarchaeota archaeon]|nr:tetratricopeptide repeat protein [Candidatus Helarchaeota archaeon]
MKWFNEGNQYFQEAKYKEAIESWEKALEIGRAQGNEQVISKCLLNIGTALSAKGDWNNALKYYKQSLELERKRDDLAGIADALANIGDSFLSLEKWEDARTYYQQSLEAIEGDEGNQARLYLNIGLTLLSEGNWNEAIQSYQKSEELFKKVGDQAGLSKCLVNIGIAFRNLGKWEEAIRYYEQSLKLDQQLGDRLGVATCLMNLGIALEVLGQTKEAIEHYQNSLAIFKDLGNDQAIASCLLNLGNAFELLKKWDKAVEFYEKSRALFEKLGDKSNISKCLTNIGIALRNLGQWNEAIKNYHESLIWFEKLNDEVAISKCLLDLGVAYFSIDKWDEAIKYYQKSRNLFQKLGDRPGEALVCQNLGWGYQKHNQVKLALKFFTEALGIYNSLLTQIASDDYRQSYAQEFADLPVVIKSLYILLEEQSQTLKSEALSSTKVEEGPDLMTQLLTQLQTNVTELDNIIKDQSGLEINKNILILRDLVDKTLLTFSASEKLKTEKISQRILSSIGLCNQIFNLSEKCTQNAVIKEIISLSNLIISKMRDSLPDLDITKAIQEKIDQIKDNFHSNDIIPVTAALELKFHTFNWTKTLFNMATSTTKLYLEMVGKSDEKTSQKLQSELDQISKRLIEEEKNYSSQILNYLIITKKISGIPLYQMNFIAAKFDTDLVSGFLSAIQSFGTEISKEKTTMEKLAYKDFKIFFQDGQFTRCALILRGEITELLLTKLKTFVAAFETKYHSLLFRETANISLFSKVDALINEYFDMKD